MGEKLAKKILDLWTGYCARKKRVCFSTQAETELSSLNPGAIPKSWCMNFM